MKKKLGGFLAVSVALLASCAPPLAAQAQPVESVNFSGSVADKSEGVPIYNAHIWVHEQSDKVTFKFSVDRQGNFSAHLPEGYYYITIGASGFAPFCKSIWIQRDSKFEFKIRLAPDYENLQDSRVKDQK